jgi:hypothetical protein
MGLGFLTGYVLGQHGRQSARLAAVAGSGTGPTLEDFLDLQDRIDRTLLVVEAMWTLLEESGYTAEQLKARIEELDASDGTVDGKRTPQATLCRECGAKVGAGLAACQFCGSTVPKDAIGPFSGV